MLLSLFSFLAAACGGNSPPRGPITHRVVVAADGTFAPASLRVRDGDTVEWTFADRRDAIVRGDSCDAPAAYDPSLPNELTGPMPLAASGVFVLGANDGVSTTRRESLTSPSTPPGAW